MRVLKYIVIFTIGFYTAKLWYNTKDNHQQKEDITITLNSVINTSKLVVTQRVISEVYNFNDSKTYFNNYISFDKNIVVLVNATVEIGYNMADLEFLINEKDKQIIIKKLPKENVTISPDIKYFDMQQSTFNTFSKDDLNTVQQKSIARIKKTMALTEIKAQAKTRFFKELSKIYQLSATYNWQVVDGTNSSFLEAFLMP